MSRPRLGVGRLAVMLLLVSALVAALASSASSRPAAKTIRVAIVGNPQMEDIAKLKPSLFTKKQGIKVNYSLR